MGRWTVAKSVGRWTVTEMEHDGMTRYYCHFAPAFVHQRCSPAAAAAGKAASKCVQSVTRFYIFRATWRVIERARAEPENGSSACVQQIVSKLAAVSFSNPGNGLAHAG